jgi:hypothetical protein
MLQKLTNKTASAILAPYHDTSFRQVCVLLPRSCIDRSAIATLNGDYQKYGKTECIITLLGGAGAW